jgi:hypothetical protein
VTTVWLFPTAISQTLTPRTAWGMCVTWTRTYVAGPTPFLPPSLPLAVFPPSVRLSSLSVRLPVSLPPSLPSSLARSVARSISGSPSVDVGRYSSRRVCFALQGVEAHKDNCPTVANTNQADGECWGLVECVVQNHDARYVPRAADGDGVGNVCDNCQFFTNKNQTDG